MPPAYTTVGPWTMQTFTLALAAAILVSAFIGFHRARLAHENGDPAPRPGPTADAYLGALLGGVLLARLGHVLLSWDYFGSNPGEILRFELGGLNWHGAVLGALLGLGLAARLRGLRGGALLDTLAPGLPLIGLAGWWGCLASGCGYGLEVSSLADYPPLTVGESADIFGIVAPRFNTQAFGVMLSAVCLLVALLLLRGGWLRGRRFWLVLALLGAGMFVIGFFRGDAVTLLAGLRLDQWFDLTLMALGCVQLVRA